MGVVGFNDEQSFVCLAARRGGTPPPVERNLLSGFKGDDATPPQSKSGRAPPSLALSLRVGSEADKETRNRPANATDVLGPGRDRDDSSHLSLGSRSRSRAPQEPVQAAAPLPMPSYRAPSTPRRATSLLRAGACCAPAGSSSAGVGLHVAAAGPTVRYHSDCDMCSFYCGLLEAATAEVGALRAKNVDLSGQVWSLRDELEREKRKVGLLQRQAAAPSASAGASDLMCRACWCRPGAVVLLHDEYLCLCRRCLADCCGNPPISRPLCAAARAGAVGADAPR